MSLNCEWFVLAERVICDSQNGGLTIVNCLERVLSLRFPAQHHGFAFAARYSLTGTVPKKGLESHHRLVRNPDSADEEVIVERSWQWPDKARANRIWLNFQLLRLVRAELLRFRLDHKVGKGAWVKGPICSLEIGVLDLTNEQRAQLRAELQAKGIPVEGLD